jgi:hypothetical protein
LPSFAKTGSARAKSAPAAHHDHQLAVAGAAGAAAHRRVEMGDAALLEAPSMGARGVRRDRAHIDHQRATLHGPGGVLGSEQHGFDRRPILQHGDDDIGVAYRFRGPISDLGALFGQRLGVGAGAVPGG